MTNKKLTNRQAISVLDGLWSNPLFGEAHRQAFELGIKAIKALEQEPCEDAIGREDMLDAIGHGTTYTSEELQRIIKDLPPVTPQPKTGHWMIDEDSTDRFFATYECSCCKRAIIVPHDVMKAVYKDYPFCHCGAKMGKRSDKE